MDDALICLSLFAILVVALVIGRVSEKAAAAKEAELDAAEDECKPEGWKAA